MQTGGTRQDVADLRQTRPEMSQLRDVLMGVMAGIPGGMADASPIGMLPRMVEGRSYTDELGEMLGADTQSGEFLAGQFASPDPLDALKVAKLAPGMEQVLEAMTLFHGSPHKWNKVDLSKVGTGEGAQAYGHGFYAAEKPEVAKSYRIPHYQALKQAAEAELGPGASVREYQKLLEKTGREPGHLYELDMPDEVAEKMLDWDKPLSQQPKEVRKAIAKEWGKETLEKLDRAGWTGQQFYQDFFGPQSTEDFAEISRRLNNIGIPGIKYLDEGSRSAGDGTRNFVVFNEKYIKPLKRNGEVISE